MASPKLIIVKGIACDDYSITLTPLSIGRALSNDFQIAAEGISRSHARITRIEDEYYIEDLNSTNGTFVNGENIKVSARLHHGDTIDIGRSVTLRFDQPRTPHRETSISELVSISGELSPGIMSEIDVSEDEPAVGFLEPDAPMDMGFLQKAYHRLAILYEVNSSVSSVTTNLQELLEKVANIVLTLKKADRVAILLVDKETGNLNPVVYREKDPESQQGRIKVSRTIVEKAISEGIGILSADALKDPRFEGAKSIEIQNVKSVICAPLKSKGEVIGVIYVDCLFLSDGFDEEDLRLLAAVCNEASIAVENAHSYREIEDLNRGLEDKVAQRTSELQEVLESLKSAQGQLVQSEKMAAMGQLVAGMAHEINNPINYIVNGIDSLSRYVGELRQMNSVYEEAARKAGADLSDVEAESRKMNYGLHMDLLDELISAINDGATRTAEIVEGLRSFSRTGEAEIKEIDVNDALDKALNLLSHSLKGRVEVIKVFGDVPPLQCYASQVGQVFLNLLNNAQQAIEENGVMSIRTWCDEETVYVSVADNGEGIESKELEKIFDPFFTTKREGEGVGLGLSISLGIVEKHNGKIEVASESGKGSTFTVSLSRSGPLPDDDPAEDDQASE